jgi:predicted nucleotide-binding protein
LIERNGKFAKLIVPISGSPHVMISRTRTSGVSEQGADTNVSGGPQLDGDTRHEDLPTVPGEPTSLPAKPGQIFIGHGRNTVPLEQIKSILDGLHVPYKVAIQEPNSGRPISEKVARAMSECTSGIFIFTGDEKVYDEEGSPVLRPSENVIFELGAGSTMFGNRIVIFKEDGVNFPTDFRDIGHIPFESQKLNAKAPELIRELVGFGILRISAA